jgi:AcrR family transcriptional regulator
MGSGNAGGRRSPGRPAGGSDQRQAILAAAREQFSALGYDRATMRGIAQAADVNASLIIHYFGSKQRLFISVLEFPMDPRVALPSVLDADPKAVGERGARLIVALIENPEARRSLLGLVRASASEPEAAQLLKQALEERIIGPIAELLHADRPELRASMMASQLVGLVMARYVVGVEPLASCDSAELAAMLAPVVEHYLAGSNG